MEHWAKLGYVVGRESGVFRHHKARKKGKIFRFEGMF